MQARKSGHGGVGILSCMPFPSCSAGWAAWRTAEPRRTRARLDRRWASDRLEIADSLHCILRSAESNYFWTNKNTLGYTGCPVHLPSFTAVIIRCCCISMHFSMYFGLDAVVSDVGSSPCTVRLKTDQKIGDFHQNRHYE